MEKYRIAILGIGGVGGFFGGKLATYYEESSKCEVIFIARNKTKEALLNNGLKVQSVDGDFIVRPDLITSDKKEIGEVDILLVSVKSYSLEQVLSKYASCVKSGGVVITVQNLVNHVDRIVKFLPKGVHLLEGCAYIISNRMGPEHVCHKGGPGTLFFGKTGGVTEFVWVEEIFRRAGIKAKIESNIDWRIWNKFLFISPLAVATVYYSCTIGQLRNDGDKASFLKGLMKDLYKLTEAKGIGLKSSEIDDHLNALDGFPEDARTSTQLDVKNGSRSELDALLDYVLMEAKKHILRLAYYEEAYKKIKGKID